MQGLLVEQLSPDLSGLRLADLPVPQREPGQALVRIRAASLNFPDLLMTRGLYQFKPAPPFVLGMELAGEVVEADPGGRWQVGDRVCGGSKTGAFAEFAVVAAEALSPVPQGMDFRAAAALGAAYTTAWTGLVELGGLREGQWVLVHGASGGVGLAACDLARALGAKVIAATGSSSKLEVLQSACNPDAALLAQGRFREEVARITGGALCNLVFDPVGGDLFDESTRCLAFGGKLLVVGFNSGRISEIAVNIPLIKGFSIVGVRAGEYARRFPERGAAIRQAVWSLAAEARLDPHIDRVLPLSRWHEGLAAMAARELVGKVVFEPGG